MLSRTLALLTAFAALAALATPADAGVIVVDPGGGNGTAALQSALTSALDGDLILVRPGVYGNPSTSSAYYETPDRSLALVADAGGAHILLHGLVIRNLSAGHEIVVRGFDLGNGDSDYQTRITDCAGSVRFEDCAGVGHPGFPLSNPFEPETFFFVDGFEPVLVEGCEQVTFERCTFTGGAGMDLLSAPTSGATNGGSGIKVRNSFVVVADCSLTGGEAGSVFVGVNTRSGGDGLRVTDVNGPSQVLVLGSTLLGGAGGASPGGSGGPGGAGVLSLNPDTPVWVRGASLAGGAGGAGAISGTAGLPLNLPPGTLTTLTAPWGSAALPAPLREGERASLVLTGAPGDVASVVMALSGVALPTQGPQGALLVDGTTMLGPLALTVIGANGTASIPFTVPHLAPGATEFPFPVQVVLSGSSGTTLGGVTVFIWVDNAF